MESYKPGDQVAVLVKAVDKPDDRHKTAEIITETYELFEIPHSYEDRVQEGDLVVLEYITREAGYHYENTGNVLRRCFDGHVVQTHVGTWRPVDEDTD